MKALPILFTAFVTTCVGQEVLDDAPDPTRASPRMKAALMAGGSAVPELMVRGLVLSSGKDGGTVMFEVPEGGRALARPGVAFNITVGGEARKLMVKRISSEGIEVEAPAQKETVIIPSFVPAPNTRKSVPGDVDYVEFRELPLLDALRMLSDQTGNNYSASVEANKIPVNAMLRNVPANSVVEEICKSHNLWFKKDETTGIMRIMTVGEFEKDLVGFREEKTEVFTLRYPNVPEVATAIADLFGDRVQLSLAAEDLDEDVRRDLEGRFDRFDVLTQRTQNTNGAGGNIIGANVSGVYSSGGYTSGFGGYEGGSGGHGSSSGLMRNRQRRNDGIDDQAQSMEEQSFRNLTPEQAQRVERSLRTGNASNREGADVEALRGRPATIYVTGSRRNSMIVVRTADSRALDDIRILVKRMDVPTPMVLLEVKILNIELGKGFESAFEYQVSDGRLGGSFTTGDINPSVTYDPITNQPTGVIALPGAGSTGLKDGQFVFQFLGDSVRARLQLLESKNRVKTVATPTLLTANNEVSRLFLGEERPVVRSITSQTIITDNNVATTPNTSTQFRNVGNTLLITPNINSDRTVTLRLVQENSVINPGGASIPVVTNGSNGTGGNVQNVPVDVVGTRSVSGTFVAKDGMAVAVGGLIEDVDRDKRDQVPVLGNIPGIGVLFRRQSKEKSRRELVMIIRPHIISTPEDGERVSKNVLRQLAPDSMDKLVEEGFLGTPLIPSAKAVEEDISTLPPLVHDVSPAGKKIHHPAEPNRTSQR